MDFTQYYTKRRVWLQGLLVGQSTGWIWKPARSLLHQNVSGEYLCRTNKTFKELCFFPSLAVDEPSGHTSSLHHRSDNDVQALLHL